MTGDFGVPSGAPAHGVSWAPLVTLWQLAGQALLVRLQALEQAAIWSGRSIPDLAAYDDAVDEYLAEVSRAWQNARQGWSAGSQVGTGPVDFVERLVADPAEPPETVMFVGFPGRAPLSDGMRFYLDADLSTFVDVARADVLHTQELPSVQAPLGGRYVWVRRDPAVVSKLEEAAARVSGSAGAAAPWTGAPWGGATPGNGDGNGGPTPVSPFSDFAATAPTTSDLTGPAGFPDDEEEIPLPPGWPQAAT